MKLIELKRRAEVFKELAELPVTIVHNKLEADYATVKWVPTKDPWVLQLSGVDPSIHAYNKTTHPEQPLYRIAYVSYGYEGEDQALPFEQADLEDINQHKMIMYSGGLYGNDILKLVRDLKEWLKIDNT